MPILKQASFLIVSNQRMERALLQHHLSQHAQVSSSSGFSQSFFNEDSLRIAVSGTIFDLFFKKR
jgi:hypothetical protein